MLYILFSLLWSEINNLFPCIRLFIYLFLRTLSSPAADSLKCDRCGTEPRQQQ